MLSEITITPIKNLFPADQSIKNIIKVPARKLKSENSDNLPEILFITSFPPRECGIATYSQDLIKSLNNKFSNSFKIQICALENDNEKHSYTEEIRYFLNTDHSNEYLQLASKINSNNNIQTVLIQHEFGFYEKKEEIFIQFLNSILKPVIVVFHTVLPFPNETIKSNVQQISNASESIIVMTNTSSEILFKDYSISKNKITVIPHGTHLVKHSDKGLLKEKYKLSGKTVLSTFGLLSSGKSIETTLEALPSIVKIYPNILFLIIGKTHPMVVKNEGEKYRRMLESKVEELQLDDNVKFINQFLPLQELLEYLQLTDIYLFSSKDPNQAVSGTFSYAISCGCPVISTPIPHACEVLQNDAGIIIDFESPSQLSDSVIKLIKDEPLRKNISSNGLHKMASTAWENAAITHAMLFEKICTDGISLQYKMPLVNLDHIKKLTTDFGMIQFSKINQPDITSGYTLDDNARALVAICQHYKLTRNESDVKYINIYFNFIKHCLQPEGYFLNYVNEQKLFTEQNNSTNLADSNGRAIWALGYLLSNSALFSNKLIIEAELIMQNALLNVSKIHSTRAMAFAIKGLYYYSKKNKSENIVSILRMLANRLAQMYKHEAEKEWQWFESYLTYANSILPEAMLCAWLATGETIYKEIAKSTFDFLMSKIFKQNKIKVISNKNWMHKGEEAIADENGGEQPIDVAYTILALSKFYEVFKNEDYLQKMEASFNWFMGNNHLQQIIYNPCTGGCYDGLEENYVNLNQGAESTVSYLLARLTVASTFLKRNNNSILQLQKLNIERLMV